MNLPAQGSQSGQSQRNAFIGGKLLLTRNLRQPCYWTLILSFLWSFWFCDFQLKDNCEYRALREKTTVLSLEFLIMTQSVHFSLRLWYVHRDDFHQKSEITFASAITWFLCKGSWANITFSECTETLPIRIYRAFFNIIFFLSRILHRRKKIIRAQCQPLFLRLSKNYFSEILGEAGLYFGPPTLFKQ